MDARQVIAELGSHPVDGLSTKAAADRVSGYLGGGDRVGFPSSPIPKKTPPITVASSLAE